MDDDDWERLGTRKSHHVLWLIPAAVLLAVWMFGDWGVHHRAPRYCPPEWKCNGKPETNARECCP